VKVFIDSNIPMYVAGAAHPNREPARRFLARVQKGEVEGCTSTEVLQEILYRYSAVGRRDLACEVYDLFVQICPEVFEVTLADTDRARDLLMALPSLSARDAVHAAAMLNREVESIASFDGAFDGVPGLRRLKFH
jgi:predicted nucleic acid-binding protein